MAPAPKLPEESFRTSRPYAWAALAKTYSPRLAEVVSPVRYLKNLRLVEHLRTESYTGLGSRHGRNLIELAREVHRKEIPGSIVDCGVWNGGSTILLGTGAPDRDVWAFDSFEGLPKPGPRDPDAHPAWEGKAQGSEELLEAGFFRYAGDPSRLHTVKGWFEHTLPAAREEVGKVAILHIDADWYESVSLALDVFYDRVVPGGFVVIDDFTTWQGARDATTEFRHQRGVTARLHGGHYWRKL